MRPKNSSILSRRSVIGGAVALGVAHAFTKTSFAQESTEDQMERNRVLQNTDRGGNTDLALRNIDAIEPVLSLDTAYNLELAILKYERIVAAGGWELLPRDAYRLIVGNKRSTVKKLKRRLVLAGDLPEDTKINDTFDSDMDVGLRTFQARHGLMINGKVDEETFYALAVPADYRLGQLRLNILRINSKAAAMKDRYALVNIPAAVIEAIDGSSVSQRHTAVVGRIDRPTPILQSRIHEINFNPYWHVPKSIIRRDLIRYMNDDPDYLTNYNIRIYNSAGRELSPTEIDWTTDDAVQYAFRQDPGAENSMGHVKINFHNTHAVYLHDTPGKSLFGQNRRFHSSGCVRVDRVDEFVAWILSENGGWDRATVEAMFNTSERLDVPVTNPVPIVTSYVTAWANRQGVVSFRDDIYEFDAQGRVDFS